MKQAGYIIAERSPGFFALIFSILLALSSCTKDSFITSPDARIATSVDSLKYDTVFTSVGSITQSFKINNLNDQKLRLSRVKLMGGAGSAFKINVNGIASSEVTDIEIASEDSIYVFVTVHINPTTVNLPFVVRDSIEITFNGNRRLVQLEAFGQNANFLRDRIIKGNVTWANNLPYVILGSLQVEEDASLKISAGCRIFSHADAPFIIDGSLLIDGNAVEKVVFTGDRLDEGYRDLPASWPGIYFRGSSKNNLLKHAVLKNAYQAIVAEQPAANGGPKVILQQCIIDNAYDAGILCVNSSLQADNCLVSNCGKNINIAYGGDYLFNHCTVAAYSVFIPHNKPVFTLTDFAEQNGSILTAGLHANIQNCIFWGEEGLVENEVVVVKQGTGIFEVNFSHCLYKAKQDPSNSILTSVIKNEDPLFDSIDVARRLFDFHISNSLAPGKEKGILTASTRDLDDNKRQAGLPDLGCYEKQ